jgi:hypothetical protein
VSKIGLAFTVISLQYTEQCTHSSRVSQNFKWEKLSFPPRLIV